MDKINLSELKTGLSGEARKNKSLFAQNLELKGKLKSHYPLDRVHQVGKPTDETDVERIRSVEKSLSSVRRPMISGEGLGNTRDVAQIHAENLALLARMTPEEIMAEQRKLVEQLDPKLVAFIRKRSDKNNSNLSSGDPNGKSNDRADENRPQIE